MVAKPDLSPPWIIFSDKSKPVAILPAGRPGEVANVEGLPMALVRRIVNAANQEGGGSYMKRMEALTSRIEAIRDNVAKGATVPMCTCGDVTELVPPSHVAGCPSLTPGQSSQGSKP